MNFAHIRWPFALLFLLAYVAACSPEVGSEAWCENLASKTKGDWTAQEAADYAKSCIIR